jgi:peptidoglycan/xylan/chitin deacetylase (PgdA/CDA1 family)
MAQLPVLMYHNVSEHDRDSTGLTISRRKLEEQFKYFYDNNYTTFHLSDLEGKKGIPVKSVLLTFDDVTLNQLQHAVPLLEKYNLKAVFFVPFAYIGRTDEWNGGTEKIMTVGQLKGLNSNVVQLGYHSYLHRHYAKLSDEEINRDFDECNRVIKEEDLNVYPALAYPYGNYPKKEPAKAHFKELLVQNNIKMAFKIGNRVNRFQFPENYEIQRIDVKGQDSLFKFRLKLRFGKLKLF